MSRAGVRVLVVLASIATVLALVAGYAERTLFNADQFTNRATSALHDESVKALIAERITDQVILKNQSDLLAARPLIQSVAASAVGGPAFTGIFRSGVRDLHRGVFEGDQNTAILRIRDIGTVIAAALDVLQPSLAGKVNRAGNVELVSRDVGTVSAKAARAADTVRLLGVILFVLALALAGIAVWVSDDRRRTVSDLGVGIACVGVVLAIALGVLRSLAVDGIANPESRAAAKAVWDAFLGDLRTAAWILAGSGAIVAAAAASMIRPIEINEPLRRVGRAIATEPARPAMRALRGVALVAAGLLFILDREAVLQLTFTAAGVYLIYAGVTALLRLVYVPPEERPAQTARPAPSRRRVLAPILAVALIAVAVAAFVGSGGVSEAAPVRGPCLGNSKLCDRLFDQVALVATHNSMAVPLPGWFASEQDAPIAAQLRDGVRGLLIDTHYADRLSNGRLRTAFDDPSDLREKAAQDGVSPDAVDAALRLRDSLGFQGTGKRGMYLCHTFCELGGTALEPVLGEIHDFLVANPDQIVVVINQDYVSPEDFVTAVDKAGLAKLVYRGPTTGKWPTVREMIDSNQRIVFLAENHAGAAPWYHLTYDGITKETPFTFRRVAQLTDPDKLAASCKPNRGDESAPIFLVNHWISTDPVPLPSHADQVNAYGPLLRRMRECERIRRHVPNLVAVNFYRRGDAFRVVRTLNGL